jgi:tetratricopeptide (TPR) repeat protein
MRLVYAAFGLLLALMTSAQCQQTAEDWFNKGNYFSEKGFYDLANKCYDDAIKLDPNNSISWNNKGETLRKLGRISEAFAAFAKANELGYNIDTPMVSPKIETNENQSNLTSNKNAQLKLTSQSNAYLKQNQLSGSNPTDYTSIWNSNMWNNKWSKEGSGDKGRPTYNP